MLFFEILSFTNHYLIGLFSEGIEGFGVVPEGTAIGTVGHQVDLFDAVRSSVIAYGTLVVADIFIQPPSTIIIGEFELLAIELKHLKTSCIL